MSSALQDGVDLHVPVTTWRVKCFEKSIFGSAKRFNFKVRVCKNDVTGIEHFFDGLKCECDSRQVQKPGGAWQLERFVCRHQVQKWQGLDFFMASLQCLMWPSTSHVLRREQHFHLHTQHVMIIVKLLFGFCDDDMVTFRWNNGSTIFFPYACMKQRNTNP